MHKIPLSYSRLLKLPNVLAVLSATCLSRLADRTFRLAIVFQALSAYGSPMPAGWISFAAIAPGLAIGPLAGAFRCFEDWHWVSPSSKSPAVS
jgi:hypothetical protein